MGEIGAGGGAPAAHAASHENGGSDEIEVTGLTGLPTDPIYPSLIQINPFHTSKANTGWNTIYIDLQQIQAGYLRTDTNQNDQITWDIPLQAGTWVIELISLTHSSAGIYSIQLDGVEKAALDGYNSEVIYNTILKSSGIVVPSTGLTELKIKMATKNPSSAGYRGYLTSISLIKTA